MSISGRWVVLVVVVSLFFSPLATRGELLFYEGFDYGPIGSDLLGKNGGVGFGSSWGPGGFNASNNTNYDVQDDSLSFGGLVTSGGSVRSGPVGAIAGLTRDLDTPLGAPGTTRYMSFLMRPEGRPHGGVFNGFIGLVLEQPLEPELFVGRPGGGAIDQYVLEDRGGSLQAASPVSAVVDETVLLVLKSEFSAGNDRFTLYVNPIPGAPEPLSGLVKNDSDVGTVQGITIYSTGQFSLDEIRVGTTYADVTPLPEPTGALLLVLGGLIASQSCPWRRPRAG